jgi:hypothetical protein
MKKFSRLFERLQKKGKERLTYSLYSVSLRFHERSDTRVETVKDRANEKINLCRYRN